MNELAVTYVGIFFMAVGILVCAINLIFYVFVIAIKLRERFFPCDEYNPDEPTLSKMNIEGKYFKIRTLHIAILALLIITSGFCYSSPIKSSGNLYVEISKGINGGTIYALPVLEWSIMQKPLLLDIEFRNNFTSPRGTIAMPNHYSSQLEVHIGQVWGNMWTTFSLGGECIYEGNDYGIPAGWNGRNTLRTGFSWK